MHLTGPGLLLQIQCGAGKASVPGFEVPEPDGLVSGARGKERFTQANVETGDLSGMKRHHQYLELGCLRRHITHSDA